MFRWLILLAFLVSCAGNPKNIEDLNDSFVVHQGILSAPPTFENGEDRLILYIRPADSDKVLVCVAENDENETLLKTLAERLSQSNPAAPVIIFGKPIRGPWKEYVTGMDIEIFAVGYYHEISEKYQTVITRYGTRFTDAVRSVGWKTFLNEIAKGAVKSAI